MSGRLTAVPRVAETVPVTQWVPNKWLTAGLALGPGVLCFT